jgi:predicted RNase H-like HicB family nuclease
MVRLARTKPTPGILAGMRYTVIFETQPDGGYHASCPALPGCHSEGDTLDDATANIREAIAVYLESLQAHGEPLPVEDILIKPLDVAVPA